MPSFDHNGQNGSKIIPFGAAHTYIAHIREFPREGGGAKA